MHCAENEKFVTVRGARRVWAVASIHGEAERLRAVHGAIEERFEPGDRIVYLGNFLGWGRAVVETVDELVQFRRAILAVPNMRVCDIVYLRGSQEEMWQKLLQLHLAVEPAAVLAWMMDRGVRQTLVSYGGDYVSALRRARSGALELARWTNEVRGLLSRHPGHQELLAIVRRAAFTAGGELLFVNAGIDVSRPLDAQNDAFWWGTDDLAVMSQSYSDYKKVVRGYDPFHPGIKIGEYGATIDCGAGFGGSLASVCFDLEGTALHTIDV